MSNPSTPAAAAAIPDESDALARLETLTADLSAAAASRDVAVAEVARLRGALEAETSAHAATRSSLATVTAERDTLAKVDRDFSARLAAEVARFGISKTPAPASATSAGPAAASKPPTLTEQAIAWRQGNGGK